MSRSGKTDHEIGPPPDYDNEDTNSYPRHQASRPSSRVSIRAPNSSYPSAPISLPSPVPFLQPDSQGQFQINEEAVRILEQAKGKLVVVAVAGPYRTGKSYLLNRMIAVNAALSNSTDGHHSSTSGFAVGNTVNACTKGIWLWSVPQYDPATNTSYVFLDTEGLNSAGEEVTFDTQIFSLSVLLSSVFVLNTPGPLNENALEQLELVTECSKSISYRSSSSSTPSSAVDSELARHFPALFWVLRDFALALEDRDGNRLTPNEYLESVLRPIPPGRKGAEEKNAIRASIKAFFTRRACIPLVRPVAEESLLRSLDTLPPSQLRPEFEKALYAFVTDIRAGAASGAFVKHVDRRPVTGPALVGLARAYASAINSGAVPSILSAWQSVVEVASKSLAMRAVEDFSTTLARQVTEAKNPIREGELVRIFDETKASIRANVQEGLPGNEEAVEKIWSWLAPRFAAEEMRVRTANAKRSEDSCRASFLRLWENESEDAPLSQRALRTLLQKRPLGPDAGRKVLLFTDALRTAYRENAVGDAAHAVESRLLSAVLRTVVSVWGEDLSKAHEEIGMLQEDLREAKESAIESAAALAEAQASADTAAGRTEIELEKITARAERAMQEAQEAREEVRSLREIREELQEQLFSLAADLSQAGHRAERGTQEIEALREKVSTLTTALAEEKRTLELAAQKTADIERKAVAGNDAMSDLRQRWEEAQRIITQQKAELTEADAEIENLTTKAALAEQYRERGGKLETELREAGIAYENLLSQARETATLLEAARSMAEQSRQQGMLAQQQVHVLEKQVEEIKAQAQTAIEQVRLTAHLEAMKEIGRENADLEAAKAAVQEHTRKRARGSLYSSDTDTSFGFDSTLGSVFAGGQASPVPTHKSKSSQVVGKKQARFGNQVVKHEFEHRSVNEQEDEDEDVDKNEIEEQRRRGETQDDSFRTVVDAPASLVSRRHTIMPYMDQRSNTLRTSSSSRARPSLRVTNNTKEEEGEREEEEGEERFVSPPQLPQGGWVSYDTGDKNSSKAKFTIVGASPAKAPPASYYGRTSSPLPSRRSGSSSSSSSSSPVVKASPGKVPKRRTSARGSVVLQRDIVTGDDPAQYTDASQLPPEAVEVRNPEDLKIQDLKYWLTSINYILPQNRPFKKQELVELVRKHDPRLWD